MINKTRWREDEDKFLHSYFAAIGDFVGEHDLGRAPGAATKRVALLKKSGAWDALDRMKSAERDYLIATGRIREQTL